MPLQRRLPKRGFKSQSLKFNGEVTLAALEQLGAGRSRPADAEASRLVGQIVKTSRSSSRAN
jgi:large subunit ribosomal protein L15